MKFIPTTYNSFSDVLDDVFDNSFYPFRSFQNDLMKTDIHEKDGNYVLEVELPGYKKEDVKVDLKDGNLTISATNNSTREEKDAKGNIIRHERYTGSCKRSFYVGDNIKSDDVHASFKDGILNITLPSKEEKKAIETKTINIE